MVGPETSNSIPELESDEKRAPATAGVISHSTSSPGSAARKGVWPSFLAKLSGRWDRMSPQVYQAGHYGQEEPKTPWGVLWKFVKFLGPGAIVSVAYVDPDNYQTAIAAGASFQYKLLFMILVSNLIAIYLQSLSLKLGTVTGMDLAQMNHRYLPRWAELFIYAIAEACIISTDLGQVIGTAIALNILIPSLPLAAACVISVVETLLILLFYNPAGELRRIRIFEIFVGLLVVAVFSTLIVALSMVSEPARDVFLGFVPSRDIFVSTGLYESCAILGGTLMPHAFYVGTSLSRARLYSYDVKHALTPGASPGSSRESVGYRPSVRAIRSCLSYSLAELVFTLFTVAIFVNSALLIISGSNFYDSSPDDDDDNNSGGVSTDLYDLFDLFSNSIAPVAGILFAVSLLFSGISAGIVATMAGQIIMEGALNIRLSPFVRRLITRCVAIIPAMIIALAVGKDGLSRALVACNYVLAIGLIFITFPVVYYTCRTKYMTVAMDDGTGTANFKNHWVTSSLAWIIWLLVVVMDLATIALIGLGLTSDDD